jgi:hypothetical protein
MLDSTNNMEAPLVIEDKSMVDMKEGNGGGSQAMVIYVPCPIVSQPVEVPHLEEDVALPNVCMIAKSYQ